MPRKNHHIEHDAGRDDGARDEKDELHGFTKIANCSLSETADNPTNEGGDEHEFGSDTPSLGGKIPPVSVTKHYQVSIQLKRSRGSQNPLSTREFIVRIQPEVLLHKRALEWEIKLTELTEPIRHKLVDECLKEFVCEYLDRAKPGFIEKGVPVNAMVKPVEVSQGFPSITPSATGIGAELWDLGSRQLPLL